MNAIGAGLLQGKWGKSCIHMNMHLWTWFCFDDRDKYVCLVKFFLKYRCNHMYDGNMLGFMLCHAKWMLGWCDMYAKCMLGYAMIDIWLGLFWDDWCHVVCLDVC